jgi:hypothetical protein
MSRADRLFFQKVVSLPEFFPYFSLNDKRAGNVMRGNVDKIKKNMVRLAQQMSYRLPK